MLTNLKQFTPSAAASPHVVGISSLHMTLILVVLSSMVITWSFSAVKALEL